VLKNLQSLQNIHTLCLNACSLDGEHKRCQACIASFLLSSRAFLVLAPLLVFPVHAFTPL
ncbi:hypothetical protein BDV19DRAFT_359921, partial [Aspergillus venezuelensis]